MAGDAATYDVFLSYNWDDSALTDKLEQALLDEGLRVFRDVEMRDFDEISDHVRSALVSSRSLVALYTESFPESAYCRWELYTALTSGYRLDGQTGRVMPVLYGVDYDDLRPRRLAELRLPPPGTAVHDVSRSVRANLAKIDRRGFGAAPTPPEPDWYPYPTTGTEDFHGRLAELWDLHDALGRVSKGRASNQARVTQGSRRCARGVRGALSSPPINQDDRRTQDRRHLKHALGANQDAAGPSGSALARVVGLGGQGKTMLAEEYARRFSQDHPGGVFILRGFGSHRQTLGDRARVRALRDDQVATFARQLDLDVHGKTRDEIDGLLRRLLRAGEPYLWIVDDLPSELDTETFLSLLAPTPNGRTLVTTRYETRGFGGAEVRLGPLDDAAALGLLTSRRPAPKGRERQAARALCADLGRHAQGLAVAAALVTRPDFGTFAKLRAAIGQPGPDAFELAEELKEELPGGHQVSIAATMLRGVGKLGADGRDVLRLASLLAPVPIPITLLTGTIARSDRLDPAAAGRRVAAGLLDAASRSLASSVAGGEPERWSVHALLSRTIRFLDRGHDRRADLRAAAVAVLAAELERSRASQAGQELLDLLPHVREIGRVLAADDERHLMNEAGRVYEELGDHWTARDVFQELYDACFAALGEDDTTTLAVMLGLAVALGSCGEHSKALALKRRVHERLREKLGGDHEDTLTALNNIAVACLNAGDHRSACRAFAAVFRARRRLLGPQHRETLTALNNYTIGLRRAGHHGWARHINRTVHELSRVVLGDDHVVTLDALNGIGVSTYKLGDMPGAYEAFASVYRSRSRTLGETHPDSLGTLENIGIVTSDPAEATSTFREAYRRRVLAYRPDTPPTLRALHNLLTSLARAPDGGGRPGPGPVARAPAPLVEAMPEELQLGEIRLDADDMDSRVELFVLANQVHDDLVESKGADDPGTLRARCYLGHATAALDQLDGQAEAAAVLLRDAADGLAIALGPQHDDVRLARRLARWVEDVIDAQDSD